MGRNSVPAIREHESGYDFIIPLQFQDENQIGKLIAPAVPGRVSRINFNDLRRRDATHSRPKEDSNL